MSPQLTTEEPNIDELAKKLGMHLPANDPAAPGFGEKTFEGDDVEPEVEAEDEEETENEQEKRNPEKNRARISFSNNGFSKAAVVAGGSLLAISAVVFFYTSVASNVSKKPPEVQKAEQQEKKPEDKRIADLQQSESQARAELALQRQQQELAKINTPEKPGTQGQQKLKSPETSTAGARTTPPPVAQSAPVRRSSVREPQVIDRSPPPLVASRPQLARLPVPSAPPMSGASTVAQVDPQAEWNRLSSLGRYGSVSPGMTQVASSGFPSSARTTSTTSTVSTASTASSPSSAISRSASDRSVATPAIERSTAPPLSQYVRSRSTASTAAAPSAQLVANADKSAESDEAQANLPTVSASRRSVLVGSTARARVVSTIVWAAGARSSPRFLIRLSEPLLGADDQPILPADSLLVVSPRPLADETGLADLEVIAVVAGDAEYATPSGSIVIRGAGGDPLMARGSRRGSTFFGDAALIVSSMLSQVGGLTNQPTTTSSTSTASGVGTVTSSSSTSPPPNYLGAAMQGGFEALSQTLSERNQAAIDEITSAPKVFQIPGGTSVQVFVNRTMTF